MIQRKLTLLAVISLALCACTGNESTSMGFANDSFLSSTSCGSFIEDSKLSSIASSSISHESSSSLSSSWRSESGQSSYVTSKKEEDFSVTSSVVEYSGDQSEDSDESSSREIPTFSFMEEESHSDVSEEDMTFELEDGSYVITSVAGSPSAISFPSIHLGIPVKAVRLNEETSQRIGPVLQSVFLDEGIEEANGLICDALNYAKFPSTIRLLHLELSATCTIDHISLPENMEDLTILSSTSSILDIRLPNSVSKNCQLQLKNSSVYSLSLPYGMKEIMDEAFCNCLNLFDLSLPETLTAIGKHAFYQCVALEEIVVPESVNSIASTDSSFFWNEIYISEGKEPIGVYEECSAFSGCTSLKKATIKGSLEHMGNLFYGCFSLKSIVFEKNLKHFYENSFYFYNLKALEDITFSDDQNFGIIRSYCFAGCESLKTICFNDTLESIYSNAFKECKKLNHVTIPESIRSIYGRAFYLCESLDDITFPDKDFSIDSNALEGTAVNFVDGYFGMNGRCYATSFDDPDSVTEVTFPGIYRTMPTNTYSGMYNLHSITIEEGVEYLDDDLCSNKVYLETLVLPSSLVTISLSALVCSVLNAWETGDYPLSVPVSYTKYTNAQIYFHGTKEQWEAYQEDIVPSLDQLFPDIAFYSENEPLEDDVSWHYVNGVATLWC